MKKGGGVLSIIGGSAGIIESITLILTAAIGLRFGTEFSALSFSMGWVGLIFSLALVLLGALVLRSSKRAHALQSLVCASVGVFLAVCVFVPMLLFGPLNEPQDSTFFASRYTAEVYGVLWSSGWYIGIFLVFGVVGGVLSTIGTRTPEAVLDETPNE